MKAFGGLLLMTGVFSCSQPLSTGQSGAVVGSGVVVN
jgi:hypothetical protein